MIHFGQATFRKKSQASEMFRDLWFSIRERLCTTADNPDSDKKKGPLRTKKRSEPFFCSKFSAARSIYIIEPPEVPVADPIIPPPERVPAPSPIIPPLKEVDMLRKGWPGVMF